MYHKLRYLFRAFLTLICLLRNLNALKTSVAIQRVFSSKEMICTPCLPCSNRKTKVIAINKKEKKQCIIHVVQYFHLLFFPSDPTHLCDVVIHIVAVVLATPPFSNYLWYHLFAADKLEDMYATAFKVHLKFYNKYCKVLIQWYLLVSVIVPVFFKCHFPNELLNKGYPLMFTYDEIT